MSDVNIRRDNLVCQVMGGDTLFFPAFYSEEENLAAGLSATRPIKGPHEEESILDHIRVLIENAKLHGCWDDGVGGVCVVCL